MLKHLTVLPQLCIPCHSSLTRVWPPKTFPCSVPWAFSIWEFLQWCLCSNCSPSNNTWIVMYIQNWSHCLLFYEEINHPCILLNSEKRMFSGMFRKKKKKEWFLLQVSWLSVTWGVLRRTNNAPQVGFFVSLYFYRGQAGKFQSNT